MRPESRRRLATLARLVMERALSPTLFHELSGALATYYPTTIAILSYDGDGRVSEAAALHGVDEPRWASYQSHFGAINPFVKAVAAHRLRNATALLNRFVPERDLFASEYYNDFMRPVGDRYVAALSLLVPGRGRISLTIYRGDRTGGIFEPDDLWLLRKLRPFLRDALALRDLAGGPTTSTVEQWLEGTARPCLDERGSPLNAAADEFRRARPHLRVVGGQTGDSDAGGAATRALAAGRTVTVLGPAASSDPLARFGFTRAERRVLYGLARGLSYREIAEVSACSFHTIHTQVRSVYRKADVGNARQLLTLLHSLGGLGVIRGVESDARDSTGATSKRS